MKKAKPDSPSSILKWLDDVKKEKVPRITGPRIGDWCVVVKDDPNGRVKVGDRVVITGDSRLSGSLSDSCYEIYSGGKHGSEAWFGKDLFKVERRFKDYSKTDGRRTK